MNSKCKPPRAVVLTAAFLLTITMLTRAETQSLPLDQLGAVATKQVEGDNLSITAIPQSGSARLRCAFQRLEGQATPEGLWLSSITEGAKGERFCLVASALGREDEIIRSVAADVSPLHHSSVEVRADSRRLLRPNRVLAHKGTVRVDGQLVRFIRLGLTEEYSVSVNGVRQDFVIAQRPEGAGDLRVELALSGAMAEATTYGAKLTLEGSGRTLAYSRLRATDATGRELSARMEVANPFKSAIRNRSGSGAGNLA